MGAGCCRPVVARRGSSDAGLVLWHFWQRWHLLFWVRSCLSHRSISREPGRCRLLQGRLDLHVDFEGLAAGRLRRVAHNAWACAFNKNLWLVVGRLWRAF